MRADGREGLLQRARGGRRPRRVGRLRRRRRGCRARARSCTSREFWAEAAGGGAVAAVQMVKLTGSALFFTALARRPLGRRTAEQLAARASTVHAGAARRAASGAASSYLDRRRRAHDHGARRAARPARRRPAAVGALDAVDGVYFTGGDAAALRAARRARVLVATPRADRALRDAGVAVDVLVHSGTDPARRSTRASSTRRRAPSSRRSARRRALGRRGRQRHLGAEPLPGPRVDAYGAGDSFAAGLTTGLAAGMPMPTRSRSARAAARRT